MAKWRQTSATLSTLLFASILISCAGTEVKRPCEWCNDEPRTIGPELLFVGLSHPYATERDARDDAMRNAVQRVVTYLGTSAVSKFQEASATFGLSSTVFDPTNAANSFMQQVSGNVAAQLKADKWYTERAKGSTGQQGYQVFVLVHVPTSAINQTFRQTAEQNMAEAQQQAKEASDEAAKEQANKMVEFWNQMREQGIVPSSED